MKVPSEFTEAAVEANSPLEEQLYSDFIRCGEPWKSIFANNPRLVPPDTRKPLEWGNGMYWDTTVARKHPYWKDRDLPTPTKDIHRMRADLRKWGFCLVEGADRQLPESLSAVWRTRLDAFLAQRPEHDGAWRKAKPSDHHANDGSRSQIGLQESMGLPMVRSGVDIR